MSSPILDRIRANGGEVIRDRCTIRLRKGRLTHKALDWVKDHHDELMMEVWPQFCRWVERSAIKEFCGGMTREDAEAAAYEEVMASA